MKPSILIVEDDPDINQLLAEILISEGYQVTQAYSGSEGKLCASQQPYSLYLLDLMLPGLTGEELLPIIRQVSNAPVIVLSAKETPQDKVALLRTGADDYLTKPFHPDELLARIAICLRRTGQNNAIAPTHLEYENIVLSIDEHKVTVDGQPVSLTALEFDILKLLLSNPKKVFTKANLYCSVWNDEFYGDDNTVNVHISNLRSKLGHPEYIETVWGIGFKMKEQIF